MTQRSIGQRLVLLIGSVGPLGHLPASGTATVAVLGVPLFWLMHTLTPPVQVAVIVVFSALSVWLHQVGDAILGEKDSSTLVWDELAGFLVAVMLVPFTWQLALIAFVLERILDITKIPPANWVERRVPGGWGVVGDDLVAGAYTCVALHLLIKFAPGTVGLSG